MCTVCRRYTNRPLQHTHPDRLPRSTSLWSVFVKLRPTSKLIKWFYHDLGTNWMIWHSTTPLSGKASAQIDLPHCSRVVTLRVVNHLLQLAVSCADIFVLFCVWSNLDNCNGTWVISLKIEREQCRKRSSFPLLPIVPLRSFRRSLTTSLCISLKTWG